MLALSIRQFLGRVDSDPLFAQSDTHVQDTAAPYSPSLSGRGLGGGSRARCTRRAERRINIDSGAPQNRQTYRRKITQDIIIGDSHDSISTRLQKAGPALIVVSSADVAHAIDLHD